MKITAFSIRRPVLTTVVYLVLVLFGGVAYYLIPIDLFPDIEVPILSVITTYRGAGAEDVEKRITKPIEESLGSVKNLDEISSTSREGVSVVSLKFDFGTDLDEAANEVRQALEWTKRLLPDEADPPMLFQFDFSMMPVIVFGVVSESGDVRNDRDYVDDYLLERLRRIPGVGSVVLFGAPRSEVHIELDRDKLARQKISLEEVVKTLRAENFSIPAGRLEEGLSELVVRFPAEFQSLDELEDMILSARGGAVVRLRDVGKVTKQLQELQAYAQVDGRPALIGGIMRQSGANTVKVAERVKAEIARFEKHMPAHLKLIEYMDSSVFIRRMMHNMTRTLLAAVTLVVVLVFLFFRRVRPTLVVAVALPTSSIVAFLAMYLMGYTMNLISMMGITLAIGMLVDNSIVVLENITRNVDEFGRSPPVAAVEGTREVGGALFGSTLTTLSVFGPLIFVSGLISILFNQLAMVVSLTIGASLAVALTLSPVMSARLVKRTRERRSDRFFVALDRGYAKVIGWALDHRALVVVLALAIAGSTFVLAKRLGMDFLPPSDSGELHLTAELPVGTALSETVRVANALEKELRALPEVSHVGYWAGVSSAGYAAIGGKQGTHIIHMSLRLKPLAERSRSDLEVAEIARQKASQFHEIVRFDVAGSEMMSSRITGAFKPVTYEVRGSDLTVMKEVALQVRDIMKEVPGLKDVVADVPEMVPELRFTLDRDKASRAMVPAAIAGAALRSALTGAPAGSYRGGSEDIDVVVRYCEVSRADVQALSKVQARSLSGRLVSLEEIGTFTDQQTPFEIKRKDKQRVIAVGASKQARAIGDIAADVEARLKKAGLFDRKDISIIATGEIEQQRETARSLMIALILGQVLVYLVMAATFESFLDPFVIIFSIPFAFTGAFLALVISGTTVSIPAWLGLIILVGVVVNNAIVLVDYVNLMRREKGMARKEALIVTGRRRLRPVLMTSLTTAFGLLPMALTSGEGATFWNPLGLVTLGGLLFSTLVTLILIPVVYDLLEFARVRRFAANGMIAHEPNPK